jgi:hypothetical protein
MGFLKLENIKDKIVESLLDKDKKISSKRLVTIIGMFLITIITLMNLMFNFKIDEYIYDGIITIILAGLGTIASEKFSK